MKNKIVILAFSILSLILSTGCQTTNTALLKNDPDFNLYDMQKKMVYIVPAQVVENNIPKQVKNPFLKPSDSFDPENIDVDLQNLLAQNFTEELGLFTSKTINKSFVIENNNGTQVVIPTVKVGDQYKAKLNNDFKVNSVLTEGCDFLFVPIALQLDNVDNVNAQFKNVDLVESGYQTTIYYVIYDVHKNKIVVSGSLVGEAEKSKMIDNSLGRNAVLLAMNSAIGKLLEEFRK